MAVRRRRSGRRYKKRGAGRRRTRHTTGRSRIRTLGNGMPLSVNTKLKYFENITLTSTTGSWAEYVYLLNSCYDPNSTGTGHQPRMFDQFAALYQRYTVKGCKVELTVVNNASSSSVLPIVGMFATPNGAGEVGGISDIVENPDRMSRIMGNQYNSNSTKFKKYYRIADYFPSRSDDADLSAAISANPAVVLYLVFGFAEALAGTMSLQFGVNLTYYVNFSQPILPTES